MLLDAAHSLSCSVAAILTCWLILPVLVLFPATLLCGFKLYRKMAQRFRRAPVLTAPARLFVIHEVLSGSRQTQQSH